MESYKMHGAGRSFEWTILFYFSYLIYEILSTLKRDEKFSTSCKCYIFSNGS
jgi:hypothetical protein